MKRSWGNGVRRWVGLPIFVPQNQERMSEQGRSNDPLHGLTLERIVTHLAESYGWEELGTHIRIRCFTDNPSVQSSLKFLRKTPWARTKVEDFYKYSLRKNKLK